MERDHIYDDKEENFFVIGHRLGGTPVVLAALGTRQSADRYRAMFEEHLEGYSFITVDVAGGLSPYDQKLKESRHESRRVAFRRAM